MTFAGLDIAEMSRAAAEASSPRCFGRTPTAQRRGLATLRTEHPEKAVVAQRIAAGPRRAPRGAARPRPRLPGARAQHADALAGRAAAAAAGDAGALEPVRRRLRARRAVGGPASRPTPRRCCGALDRLKAAGNSLFVVEHELDVIRHADWIVDVGPAAGEHGGRDPLQRPARRASREVEASQTRRYLFGEQTPPRARRRATPQGWLRLERRHAQQPARPRRRVPARRVHDA